MFQKLNSSSLDNRKTVEPESPTEVRFELKPFLNEDSYFHAPSFSSDLQAIILDSRILKKIA